MTSYVVAAIKPWNVSAFRRHAPSLAGSWHLVQTPDELLPTVQACAPRFVFFPHWSWRVPDEVLRASECVCFHMTDLPFGRGGSPLQNLIEAGKRETVVTALRMTSELDAGPIYAKRRLGLDGRAQDIYERAAEIVWSLIAELVAREPVPVEQEGEPVFFRRRTPEQSRLPADGSLGRLYDHIRMLDAETYPAAFVDHGEFRLEFENAELQDGEVRASVVIRRRT